MPCSTAVDPSADKAEKALPCRGCTANCRNIAYCEGRPWRQLDKT